MAKVEFKNLYEVNGIWTARLAVPMDARAALGRSIFKWSTGHKELASAAVAAHPVIRGWRETIQRVRQSGQTPAPLAPRQIPVPVLRLEALKLPTSTPIGAYKAEWLATLKHMMARQRDQYGRDLDRFSAQAGSSVTLETLTGIDVQKYVDRLLAQEISPKTVKRQMSALNNYYSYARSRGIVSEDLASPFMRRRIPQRNRLDAAKARRQHFTPAQVMQLCADSIATNDRDLADLIIMAAYTGARIEELAGLAVRAVDCAAKTLHVTSKTDAGDRLVPMHDLLVPVIQRRAAAAQDGIWLFHVSGKNQYNERSMALGKRFGRLKTAAGYGPEFVFHSIRKTVATLFEDVQCPEGIAADILGHEKPTMTYGLYSGGSSMATRRAWLEKALVYPCTQAPQTTTARAG